MLRFQSLLLVLFALLYNSCSIRPKSVERLHRAGVQTHKNKTKVTSGTSGTDSLDVLYLGSGGIFITRNNQGLLVDPFFSHQSTIKIGHSVFVGKSGKKTFRSDPKMVRKGIARIKEMNAEPVAILIAHSHYDHLMDVPALIQEMELKVPLLINQTGHNVVHKVVDTASMVILEKIASTPTTLNAPYELPSSTGKIRIYPIFSDHNPHFRNVKFFSGVHVKKVNDFTSPYDRTKANLWLEGNTFSFLIDYVNQENEIDFRVFIQSSSCHAPNGIPPALLLHRPVDLAVLGVVSYHFSPDYPCVLLDAIKPRSILWVHWEDFFRKYTKKPKLVRGTDIPAFFSMPCVSQYKDNGRVLWPGAVLSVTY